MKKKKSNIWILKIFVLTFAISMLFSILSDTVIKNSGIAFSFLTLVFFILIGIVFDIVGIAVTTANLAPFNAMSARKIRGSREAVELVNNADKVANFCNDVIGDIAGIMSGAAVSVIVISLKSLDYTIFNISLIGVLLSGIVASLTVSGKALGKSIAMNNWKYIIRITSLVMYFIEEKLKIKVLNK